MVEVRVGQQEYEFWMSPGGFQRVVHRKGVKRNLSRLTRGGEQLSQSGVKQVAVIDVAPEMVTTSEAEEFAAVEDQADDVKGRAHGLAFGQSPF